LSILKIIDKGDIVTLVTDIKREAGIDDETVHKPPEYNSTGRAELPGYRDYRPQTDSGHMLARNRVFGD